MPASPAELPQEITDVEQLEDLLSEPTQAAIETLEKIEGDILILGVAGKMGPTLARMARRASDAAGSSRRIIGVSRFSDAGAQESLEARGVETLRGDLLDQAFVDSLPEAPNIVYMTGMKFGSSGNQSLTWAMNALLPSLICRRYPQSRIAAFSTGNVYGLVPVTGVASLEPDDLNPVGEYAMSCLGRERMFEHFSITQGTPTAILRLNYANELRYGVLMDLARQVFAEQVIDVSMGYANVIWQGDANAMTLCSLGDVASPPLCLNIAGPELLCIREVCQRLGDLMDKPVRFTGEEAADALLSDGSKGHELYGKPRVDAEQMIRWAAAWTVTGGESLGKPTHFEVRSGKF